MPSSQRLRNSSQGKGGEDPNIRIACLHVPAPAVAQSSSVCTAPRGILRFLSPNAGIHHLLPSRKPPCSPTVSLPPVRQPHGVAFRERVIRPTDKLFWHTTVMCSARLSLQDRAHHERLTPQPVEPFLQMNSSHKSKAAPRCCCCRRRCCSSRSLLADTA